MKKLFLFVPLILVISIYKPMANVRSGDAVTFVAEVNKEDATPEGLQMQGYIVHVKRSLIEKLDGEKVKVSGKVTLVKPAMHMQDSKSSYSSSRLTFTKHILKPRIQVLD